MIPNAQSRQVTGQGLSGSRAFTVSNFNFIKMILRDKIYRDKELAVLREYGSNGWDSHRMSGQPTRPIKVTLPTTLDPVLCIRDFGEGLTPDQMTVFTDYGESTKRDTDNANGCLGLGCKSGFAYGDQFTVISWTGGMKRIYNAVLTDDGDDFSLMGETTCPADETGVEIRIPVRVEDITSFEQKARAIYQHFDPQPEINTDLPQPKGQQRTHGIIDAVTKQDSNSYHYGPRGGTWFARMGCVAYPVALDQIQAELEAEDLWGALQHMNGGLYFDMGAVEFTVSREELEYTDQTKLALVGKFRALVDEYTEEILATLKSTQMSAWDKRLKANFMRGTLRLPVPARYKEWCRDTIKFSREVKAPKDAKDAQGNLLKTVTVTPETFSLRMKAHDGPKVVTSMKVSVTTKIYLKDDPRHLTGYRLHSDHIVVVPLKGQTVDSAKAELNKWLAKLDCKGITVENLSSLHWHSTFNGRVPDRRHSVHSFKLAAAHVSAHRGKLSENWEIEKRVPEDTDVFVILAHFKVNDSSNFYTQVSEDRALARALDIPFPEVYGYKTTAKRPKTAADCTGTVYATWRVGFFRRSLNSTMMRQISDYHWASLFNSGYSYNSKTQKYWSLGLLLGLCRDKLGMKHPISKLMSSHQQGQKAHAKLPRKRQNAVETLARVCKTSRRPTAQVALDKATALYPLLPGTHNDFKVLASEDGSMWLEYLLMADKAAGRTF